MSRPGPGLNLGSSAPQAATLAKSYRDYDYFYLLHGWPSVWRARSLTVHLMVLHISSSHRMIASRSPPDQTLGNPSPLDNLASQTCPGRGLNF